MWEVLSKEGFSGLHQRPMRPSEMPVTPAAPGSESLRGSQSLRKEPWSSRGLCLSQLGLPHEPGSL